jgi:hypothetical protein
VFTQKPGLSAHGVPATLIGAGGTQVNEGASILRDTGERHLALC